MKKNKPFWIVSAFLLICAVFLSFFAVKYVNVKKDLESGMEMNARSIYYLSESFEIPGEGHFRDIALFNEDYRILGTLQPKNPYEKVSELLNSYERVLFETKRFGVVPELEALNGRFYTYIAILYTGFDGASMSAADFKRNIKKLETYIDEELSSNEEEVSNTYDALLREDIHNLEEQLLSLGYVPLDGKE